MAHYRLIAQLLTAGGVALGRALLQAWKEGAHKVAQEGVHNAAGAAAAIRSLGLVEARKILNVPDNASVEEIEKNFNHIFEANSAEKGNSFYLQSKAVRARESLLASLEKLDEQRNNDDHNDPEPPSAMSSKQ